MDHLRWMPVEPKDPDATRRVQWDLSVDVEAEGATLLSATVTQVDCDDEPVVPPTVAIGTPEVSPGGFVTVSVSGGVVDTNVLLRCAYTMTTGADHATILLPIRHR